MKNVFSEVQGDATYLHVLFKGIMNAKNELNVFLSLFFNHKHLLKRNDVEVSEFAANPSL